MSEAAGMQDKVIFINMMGARRAMLRCLTSICNLWIVQSIFRPQSAAAVSRVGGGGGGGRRTPPPHQRSLLPVVPPTSEVYGEIQHAFDVFNQELFGGRLPHCLITLQRADHRCMGYFSAGRFLRITGEKTDEIALNPLYFGTQPIATNLSTLLHEMVHAWQFHHGKSQPRRCYHNVEWADRMESVGLMPSDTGRPGGRRVGEHMSDYVIAGGPFERLCRDMLTRDFALSWLDRFPVTPPEPGSFLYAPQGEHSTVAEIEPYPQGDEDLLAQLLSIQYVRPTIDLSELFVMPPTRGANRTNRVKYRCPSCLAQAWGKPGLLLICGEPACEGSRFEDVITD